MKKSNILLILITIILCLWVLCGCFNQNKIEVVTNELETDKEKVTFPISNLLEFGYSSGAGAWFTTLNLKPDGTFIGYFHNSEMGENAADYPHGTVYTADFSGKFTEIKKVNEYSYTAVLSELIVENEGNEWIEEKIRYVISQPEGLSEGDEFVFYTPQAPLCKLQDEFLNWRHNVTSGNVSSETLSVYGLYNKTFGSGFFTTE